jgi:hypothetical protein
MKERIKAIEELAAFLKADSAAIGVNSIITNPSIAVNPKKLIAVHIHAGDDKIIKASSSPSGYPKRREAIIIFEIWMNKDDEADVVFDNVRKCVLGGTLSNATSSIFETGSNGPFNGGIPGAQAMQLFTGLKYQDCGPFDE